MLIRFLNYLKRKTNQDMYKYCAGCNHLGFDRTCMKMCMKGYDGICPRSEINYQKGKD